MYANLFYTHAGRQVDKWRHYFEAYDRHLFRRDLRAPRVLEIGVDHGGSLELWRAFFGADSTIVGIDNRPECAFEAEGIEVRIGDQTDAAFLASLGEFDVIIDDGSHKREDQTASFQALWPKTRHVYVIEDCHDGYPYLGAARLHRYDYPGMVVIERPQRLIRGNPARELRPDELEARKQFGPEADGR